MSEIFRQTRKTVFTVWPLLVTVGGLLLLSWGALSVMTETRAFIHGESLWSKAQKDAIIHILAYTRTRHDADYQIFTKSIALILGDKRAREALDRSPPDLAEARRGFFDGGNDVADLDGISELYLRFRDARFMKTAVSAWTTAEGIVLELEAAGVAMHDDLVAGRAAHDDVERFRDRVIDYNRGLTALEAEFSESIGMAARRTRAVLFSIMLGATAALVSLGLLIISRVLTASEHTQRERDRLNDDVQLAFELAQAVNRVTLLDEVYEPALDALDRGLAVDHTAVRLFDSGGQMRFAAWRDLSEAYRAETAALTFWSPGEARPCPVLVEDVRDDPRCAPYREAMARDGIVAMAAIPLIHQGGLLGELVVYAGRKRRFAEREIRVAQTIASQVAAAVARARLFESERTYASECARLYEAERVAVSMRDQFITIASHELRTPLTALKLNTELIDRSRQDAGQVGILVEKLNGNIGRLERLILQLLEVSRVNSGGLALERRRTDFAAIVRAVILRAQPELIRSGSTLESTIAEVSSEQWDPERLDQVVTNLLHNAIKYGQGKLIELRLEADDSVAVLVVRDHGIGVAPEDQGRIFERFERAVSVQHFGGFGLGLWIVRAVVDAHGGRISIKSALGQGAEFRVELPLRPSA